MRRFSNSILHIRSLESVGQLLHQPEIRQTFRTLSFPVRHAPVIFGCLHIAKLFRLAALGLSLAVFVRAETAREPVEIDIPIQAQAYGAAFFEETARMFEKLRPDVRVNLTGNARVHEKVRIRVMAGDLPNATDADLLYDKMIDAQQIVDLTPFLDGPDWEGTGRWRDRFLPGVLNRWTHDGKVYGVPFAYAVWAIFYNKEMFAEHGWETPRTWDEFFQLCEKIRAQGIAPLTLPGVYMRYGDSFCARHITILSAPKATVPITNSHLARAPIRVSSARPRSSSAPRSTICSKAGKA